MYTIKRQRDLFLLPPKDLATYQSFTTFPYNQMLANPEKQKMLITVAALAEDNSLIGLGVLFKMAQDRIAQLVSVYVTKEWRHQKIGTKLVEQLEKELLEEKEPYTIIFSTYPATTPSSPFIEKILVKQHWEIKDRLTFGKVPSDAKVKEWLYKPFKMPPSFEVFKWKDLTTADREYILRKKETENWYESPTFSPFEKEEDIEFLNSLGLRYKGDIIGWIITHRILADTIQYWCLFIDPKFIKTGVGMQLLVEAMRLQVGAPFTYAAFAFKDSRFNEIPQWKAFFTKRIYPHCSLILKTNQAVKMLRGKLDK